MNNTSNHIVFLTPGFAASEQDSVVIPALQVFLKSIRKTLPNAKLTLISFQFPFTEEIYDWHDIQVIPLNGQNRKLRKLKTWRKASKTLKRLHRTHKIDTIHSFWIGECARIGQKFAKKYNIRHIVTVMGQDAALKNSHGNELIHTDVKLVTLSENHQKELLANYDLNSTVIPWHLDVSEFPELQENSIDILGVGSINQVKNYEDFIEVISAVAKTFPSLNVSILGDGEIRPRIERKIKDLQLENTITLLGHLPRAFVLEEMAQAKILLHTSSYESFGFVFLEALYSGMHIVSYNVGLAKTSATWHVCDNKTELIETCKRLLSENNSQKERVTIGSELETINAYLSLYHA